MVSSKLLLKAKSVQTFWGHFNYQKEFELKINTDSRNFNKKETFVALVGESFDGFNYLESVLEKGARVVVFKFTKERESWAQTAALFYPETLFVLVTDTLIFIQELAYLHMLAWKKAKSGRKVIGITGSNGKTTHKEMMYFLLDSIFPKKVLATKGNLNNHIGVPLTIFRLSKQHDIAIIEMGMNHAGEIQALCDIAVPEHGMITNIGAAHIEFLKSMENIFKEKSILYKNVLKNSKGKGVFVVNADDKYLCRLEKSKGLLTYGEDSGDVRVSIAKSQIVFNILGTTVLITNKNILEHHNLKNLAGTTLFAIMLFPKKIQKIIHSAASYVQPSMNRSQWIENIFLDAYNANPSSMRVSLKSFVDIMNEKKIDLNDCYFVLGDMNELGDHAEEMHIEIAKLVKELGITNVTFLGRYSNFYLKGYSNPSSSFEKKENFYEEWKHVRKQYKFIFIKASRSLQLETLMSIV